MILPLSLLIALVAPALPDGLPGVVAVDYPAKGGQVVTYAGAGQVTWLVPTKLTGDAKSVFDADFLPQGYFGAFAMSPDGGYGYASGTGTIEAAREIALAQCNDVNNGCRIVAELLPSDWAPPGPGVFTLSEAMTAEYNTSGRADHRAFAISEDGAYAMVWGHASQSAADADARAQCQSSMLQLDLGLRSMPCVMVPGL